MMNKLTMAFLTAAVTLGSSAAMAVNGNNNGNANQAADAGAVSGGAEQSLAPSHVSNDRINEGSSNTASGTQQHHKMNHHNKQNSSQMHNSNKKTAPGADRKTDGTTR